MNPQPRLLQRNPNIKPLRFGIMDFNELQPLSSDCDCQPAGCQRWWASGLQEVSQVLLNLIGVSGCVVGLCVMYRILLGCSACCGVQSSEILSAGCYKDLDFDHGVILLESFGLGFRVQGDVPKFLAQGFEVNEDQRPPAQSTETRPQAKLWAKLATG